MTYHVAAPQPRQPQATVPCSLCPSTPSLLPARPRGRLAAIITIGEGGQKVAAKRTPARQRELNDLLTRDRTLNEAILFGLDGHIVEMQARTMQVLREPLPLARVTKISGMAREGVHESLDRIAGALAKLELAESQMSVIVNLAPPDLPKDGSWLDLPLAILMLQAAGTLPDLPEYQEGDFILFGEVGLHGVRRPKVAEKGKGGSRGAGL